MMSSEMCDSTMAPQLLNEQHDTRVGDEAATAQ
jgi:hypothetical protein